MMICMRQVLALPKRNNHVPNVIAFSLPNRTRPRRRFCLTLYDDRRKVPTRQCLVITRFSTSSHHRLILSVD
jgi:hypothetical protein